MLSIILKLYTNLEYQNIFCNPFAAHLICGLPRTQLLVIPTRKMHMPYICIKITMNNCHFALLFVLSRAHYTGSWDVSTATVKGEKRRQKRQKVAAGTCQFASVHRRAVTFALYDRNVQFLAGHKRTSSQRCRWTEHWTGQLAEQ